jgi:hypothetical protein
VACYLRNRQKRPAVECLLRDGHVGYLLKKMRQVRDVVYVWCVWCVGEGMDGWMDGWCLSWLCFVCISILSHQRNGMNQPTHPPTPLHTHTHPYTHTHHHQVMMWEAGFDADRERRCDGVTVRRAANGLPQSRVQLQPPPPAPVMTMGASRWVRFLWGGVCVGVAVWVFVCVFVVGLWVGG